MPLRLSPAPLFAALLSLLLLAGCGGKRDASQQQEAQVRKSADGREEILLRDIALRQDSVYLAVRESDSAFLQVDSIVEGLLYGMWHQLEEGSDCLASRSVSLRAEELDSFLFTPYLRTHSRPVVDQRFLRPLFPVETTHDIAYATANGYWASKPLPPGQKAGKIIGEGLAQSFKQRPLQLTMDLYRPQGCDSCLRPAILLLHGGAFYVGDKEEEHIARWCRQWAERGYVALSVNYRMGFRPTKRDIARAMQNAETDLQSATRYVVGHASEWGIDTAYLFLAGTSAGAITALQAAFAPKRAARFRAVANMWGATNDLASLRHARTSIVSFHGDADPLVPYDEGYPFANLGDGKVGKMLFGKMYGSKVIQAEAKRRGLRCQLYTYPGCGHALHLDANHQPDTARANEILRRTVHFFYQEMVPRKAAITACPDNPRHYTLENGTASHWHVQGGYLLKEEGNDVWVVWEEQPRHLLEATGHYTPFRIAFTTQKEISL